MFKKKDSVNIPEDVKVKCHAIIHTATTAAGATGAVGSQIPLADNAILVPIQITMIVSLGQVFGLEITKTTANAIIKSAAASFVGRSISQVLIGWTPIIGNAINATTAAGLTEAIGWLTVKEFVEKADKYKKMSVDSKDKDEAQKNSSQQSSMQEEAEKHRKEESKDDFQFDWNEEI